MPCHRAIKFWLLKRILPRRPITQPWSSKVEPLPELEPKSNQALSLKLIMEEISNSIMAVTIKISIIIFNLQPWFQVSISTKIYIFAPKIKSRLMRNHFIGNHVRWGIAFCYYETSLNQDRLRKYKKFLWQQNKKSKSKETVWIFLTIILPYS